MSAPAQIAGGPVTVRLGRAALWVIFGLSAVVAAFTLILGVRQLATSLSSGTTLVTLVATKALPAAANGVSTTIATGSYNDATLTLLGAPPAVVALSVLSNIGQFLAETSLAIGVGLVAWRVLRPRLFRRSLSRQFTVLGAVIFLSAVLWQVGAMFAAALAAVALNSPHRHGFWPLAGRLDPTYIAIGFAFLIIGLTFEYGERLQKETEGLV